MADLRACNDCAAQPGEPHGDGCDVARCMAYGTQRIQCGPGSRLVPHVGLYGGIEVTMVFDGHDCGKDVWSGEWPGVAECREWGWWACFVPYGDPSWRPCSPAHPGAVPDLNRLVTEARWDRSAKRWVRTGD